MKNYTSFTRKKSISFTAWNAKIIFIISVALSISNQCKGQVLYGTTSHGGEGAGTITKYDVSSNTLTDVFVYEVPGNMPNELVEASNGKLYGTTRGGGSNNGGTIYSLDAVTYKYAKLKNLDLGSNGGLVEGAGKKLYGISFTTIFSFDPTSSDYTTLKTFTNTDGYPYGKLVQLADGRLYGVTGGPGRNNEGLIFSFDPVISVYTVLKIFNNPLEGEFLIGSLLRGADGKLYGVTKAGGVFDRGVMFCLDPVTAIYTKLIDFTKKSGAPNGGLMQASNGEIYGMTTQVKTSESTFFSYNINTSKYTVVSEKLFSSFYGLAGSLIQGNDGKLYGHLGDALFSLDPVTKVFTKIRDHHYPSASGPSGMIKISNGKLIGSLTNGGSYRNGGIFIFDPGSNVYRSLDPFNYNNGLHPSGGLLAASNGKLYGTTSDGGRGYYGVVFCFDPISATYTKLKDFVGGEDGRLPNANLVEAFDKMIYGTTAEGGLSFFGGVLFSFDPVSSRYKKIQDFNGGDGARPNEGLVQASNGRLYGTTVDGGTFGNGVIFSFDPATAKYDKIKEFNHRTGYYTTQGLMQANNGRLYGTTGAGGSNNLGTLFSLDPVTLRMTVPLNGSLDKGYFTGKLIQAVDNKLYGLAGGGRYGAGVMFSYDPAPCTYRKLRDFNFIDGAYPTGSLVSASDGKLYGSTPRGGSRDEGVLFSYDIKSSTFKKLLDLQNHGGINPLSTLIEYPANPKVASHRMAVPEVQIAGTSLFTVKASPNPSTTNFLVEIQGSLKDEPVEIVVTDISGRKVYQRTGALSGQYRFGDLLTPGVYFVRVTQGQNIQTIKVIKAGTSDK